MKKIELLSPAGDLECLKMAVKCGCDAVYISGKEFGARAYAKNFTLEEIEEAVKYCHLYDVKIYVTVNTLVEDNKQEEVINYIEKLHNYGVDALIMQDIGLISLIHEKFPNLEIHASTQTHITNNESLKFLKALGCKRAVLAREMNIQDIKEINTDMELEVFIHGALCVCYSGCCLMSSRMFGRSGNKGECAGPCRFLYDLYVNNQRLLKNSYLLSMKELCVNKNIEELIKLGISSLKIEGRMKSKYYVGYVTKFYRNLIDKYYNQEELTYSEEEYRNLLKLYSREFTTGYLNNDENVVNNKTCNHQGYPLGKVLHTGNRIKIKLSEDITQGDGIRFSNGKGMICNYIYNKKGLLINSASKNDIIYLDNKIGIKENCIINKTLDRQLEKDIESIKDKKIEIDFKVKAHKNKDLTISIIDKDIEITKSLGLVSKAINKPVTKEDILDKLSKLGTTPFKLNKIYFDIEKDIFIPIKNINILKRELVEDLIKEKERRKTNIIKKDIVLKSNCNRITNEISFLVRNEKQLKVLLNYDVFIYVEDINLYNRYKNNKKVYYRNSRVGACRIEKNTIITNMSGLKGESNKISDIYMNVYNSTTLNLFFKYVYKVGLSPELSVYEVNSLIKSYKNKYKENPNVEVLIYGKLELMIMKYCPVKQFICKENCSMCLNKNIYLDDKNGHKFRLLGDNNHYMRVFDYKDINYIDDIAYLKSSGVTNFRIDLLDESDEEIIYILDKVNSVLLN